MPNNYHCAACNYEEALEDRKHDKNRKHDCRFCGAKHMLYGPYSGSCTLCQRCATCGISMELHVGGGAYECTRAVSTALARTQMLNEQAVHDAVAAKLAEHTLVTDAANNVECACGFTTYTHNEWNEHRLNVLMGVW